MKKRMFKPLIFIVLSSILIMACQKDETRPNPTMSFITDDGYTFQNESFASGDTLWVGLNCKWNGTDIMQRINFYANEVQVNSVTIDEADGQEFELTVKLMKHQLDSEKWDFELVDANGQKTVSSLTLTKDQSGMAVINITSIKLGTQTNATNGGFYAINNGETYFLNDAFANQALIDLVCAYDTENKTFLASPGANLDGIYDLSGWTTINTSYYCATEILPEQFDLIDTDALIIEAFNVDNQKRKAKNLTVDDIYVFKTQSGKYGIFMVTDADKSPDGTVTIDIKVQ